MSILVYKLNKMSAKSLCCALNRFFFVSIIGVLLLSCAQPGSKSDTVNNNDSLGQQKTLRQVSQIALPAVKGGFDLMALDLITNRLFLSAEDNHTVEVVDVMANKLIKSLPGFNEPKWVVYRPETNIAYISTGLDAKVTAINATTYQTIRSFTFKEKCNNLRYDSASNQLYVGVGNTFGALGVINLNNDKIMSEIPLSGYPKQFEIDGNRIYVNIPSKNIIDVVDRKAGKIIESWPVTVGTENIPMGFDRLHHRLFVACNSGEFLVFSTETGKAIDSIKISKEADGIYYDTARKQIYVSCGEGFIEVIKQSDPDHYHSLEKIPTAEGAGTSLFSPKLNKFILAIPQTKNNSAQLRIYEPIN